MLVKLFTIKLKIIHLLTICKISINYNLGQFQKWTPSNVSQIKLTHQTFLENVISLVDIRALACSFINDICVQTHIECMERMESTPLCSYTLWMSGLWRDAVVDDFGRKQHFNEFFLFIFILVNPKNKHIYTARKQHICLE